VDPRSLEDQVAALDDGRAYAELDDHDVTLVSGRDARGWLNDLITTDVETLERGQTRPSMLLTPTGRIRALFHVLCLSEGFALVQRTDQAERIGRLLDPYVLSSDVTLRERPYHVIAVPGRDRPPPRLDNGWRPSLLGGGHDLLFLDPGDVDLLRDDLADEPLARAHADAVERRRIRRGQPRFGVDLDADSFPAEAGLDLPPVTDRSKGCFLGQEAVAKIANLGHPPRVVVAVEAPGVVLEAGEPVSAGGEPVGVVTSAAGDRGLARVRWGAPLDRLRTAGGAELAATVPPPQPV
jgi:tRNA-modifying protein YgfZ